MAIKNFADWAIENNVVSDPLFHQVAKLWNQLITKYQIKNILVETED